MARSRRIALVAVVAALLVFANAAQADIDDASMFHSVGFAGSDLDAVFAARQADVRTQAWLEYLSLVTAGGGAIVVVRPPRRPRGRRR